MYHDWYCLNWVWLANYECTSCREFESVRHTWEVGDALFFSRNTRKGRDVNRCSVTRRPKKTFRHHLANPVVVILVITWDQHRKNVRHWRQSEYNDDRFQFVRTSVVYDLVVATSVTKMMMIQELMMSFQLLLSLQSRRRPQDESVISWQSSLSAVSGLD